ncbi:oligosaccharide flippase family protein [Flammeovirga yaeyamensis]|uniref:Oligosaccharide flippase family protein n=2 Tax=Flammeovirga yaeyamensis TaxID=367791 RepID=A0AAX1N2A5_9BACT|nr:O-antigen/teichoic acid export membrane protein [Flammeovirga yaeyamensis]NMF35127.1 oligosaccharide flippase family protein [Flammeovirga yaeyamensis]QWG00053.1 oligosaccharide flippase family protein [Flammeovirga yaeyamensis]
MRLINYLLVPIHTKVFSPDDFGILSLFYSYAVLFNVIYTYGMETTYFRFATKDKENKDKVFSKVLSSVIITSVLFSGILWICTPYISTYLDYDNSSTFVKVFATLFAVDAILAIPFASLRVEGKAKRFAILKIIEVLLTVGLNYLFLVIFNDLYAAAEPTSLLGQYYDPEFGLGYSFVANLISKVSILILLSDKILKVKLQWSWKSMKPYYKYGFPLLFSGLAFAVNEVFDRILIPILLPKDFYAFGDAEYALGVYSACYKLSIFVTFTVQAYKYAAEPFFFNQANSKDSPKVFANIMYYFVIVLMLMVVGVTANLEWLASIFIRQKEYLIGLPVVPILLMANIFLGMYYNLSVWFKVTDNTKYGAIISFIGAGITLTLNFILIPLLGFYGSAIATFVCYFSMMVIAYLLGNKYYPIPYNVKMISFYLILGGAFLVLFFNLPKQEFWPQLITQNVLFIGFIIIIAISERNFLKRVFGNRENTTK